eukprot:TRINITY_DN35108_c0_g1_i1.p1 TRINITY_DN35108_c0_g1~~TRINITY_DN35108_c0_g1_i1.p1  ORF type:complete len:199 (+),score=57.97 TRINITY_DN35108_c0_g1_i1:46-642(+)
MVGRKGTGVHQNSTAWVAHKHQEDLKLTEDRLRGFTDNCCEKCVEVLQWRKNYGKYKMLAKATKCHGCQQKTVVRAYHGMCIPCARLKKQCAKCEGPFAIPEEELARMAKEAELRKQIQDLPERFKRTAERKLERGDDLAQVEKAVLAGQGKKAAKAQTPVAANSKTAEPTDSAEQQKKPTNEKTPQPDSDSDSDEVL